MSCTITVTGATGNVGQVLSGILIGNGHRVRVVGRDPGRLQPFVDRGAEAFAGDLTDSPFLTRAYHGADAAFVMIPPDTTADDQRGRAETFARSHAAAIRESGLPCVVLLSSLGAHIDHGVGIIDTLSILEREAGAIDGVNTRILRAAYFLENLWPQVDVIKNLGFIAGPLLPDVKQPMAAARDVAAVAAARLETRDFTGSTIEYVLGAADYSYNDIAAALTRALGRNIMYMHVPDRDLKAALVPMGMAPGFVDCVLEMSHAINEQRLGGAHTRTPANTTPTTLDDFATWFASAMG